MTTLFDELIARLRWQPGYVAALRAQLERHPDVAARLREALPEPRDVENQGNPSLEPVDGWLRH